MNMFSIHANNCVWAAVESMYLKVQLRRVFLFACEFVRCGSRLCISAIYV